MSERIRFVKLPPMNRCRRMLLLCVLTLVTLLGWFATWHLSLLCIVPTFAAFGVMAWGAFAPDGVWPWGDDT